MVQVAEQPAQGHGAVRGGRLRKGGAVGRERPRGEGGQRRLRQRAHELVEPHSLVAVMLDRDPVGGGMDRAPLGQHRRVGAQVDVRQDRAEHQQAVGIVDELLHLVPPEHPAVDTNGQRMVLADD